MTTVVRRAALVVVGTLAGLALVEAGLRIWLSADELSRRSGGEPGPTTVVAHPFLPYAGKPSIEYSLELDVAGERVPVRVRNNAYGLRAHELPTEKRTEDYFVIALGGSTTRGYTAGSNATTWPELLEARLRATYRDRNVRVFNFGSEAATTVYNVVMLALVGVHLGPDLVLVYHGFNDYGPLTAADYRTDHAHHFRDADPETRWHGLRAALPTWMQSSYTLALAAARIDRALGLRDLQALAEMPHTILSDDVDAAVARILPNLVTLRSIAAGAGAEILLSTFQFRDGDHAGWRALNGTLRRFYEDNGLPYADVDALIADGDASLQIDDCHFTDDGRGAVADAFFDEIVARGFLLR